MSQSNAQEILENTERDIFSIEQAKKFVDENEYPIDSAKDFTNQTKGCIDDRENDRRGSLPDIAIPGAGIGLIISSIAALTLLSERYGGGGIDLEKFVKSVENVIGTPTYHTDEKHEHDDLSCAGCGHCKGSLDNIDAYLLSEEQASFLKDAYLPSLKARGISPKIYSGEHDTKGVFVIDDMAIGLPATGFGGERAYRYHRAWHEQGLREIAEITYPIVNSSYPTVPLSVYGDILKEAAEKQLTNTVSRLASDKPKFIVKKDEEGVTIVSILSPETVPEMIA